MIRLCVLLAGLLGSVLVGEADAAVKRWRVGDATHPWILRPVSGRLSWGRGWACEILLDDDGDGRIDEDGVELVDNDGDALINEDGPDPQIDNDGDGRLNEDPADGRDNDGDGLVDEDPVDAYDTDYDGLIDEDGPDPQIDNDGDGRLNEDGRFSNLDDDYDGRLNEDPTNGIDDDGDGLVDEDPPLPAEDIAQGRTTWLSPIHLDATRNLLTELNQRYLQGEFGGMVPGKPMQKPFMMVPTEREYRNEVSDPISAQRFGFFSVLDRSNYGAMVDGDLNTAFGSAESNWSLAANLMGMYRMDRVVFRPRPTVPGSTMLNYIIYYGDASTVSITTEQMEAPNIFVPAKYGQANPPVQDWTLEKPILTGRIDIQTLNPYASGRREEIAEGGFFGVGYPTDASYTSEIIDIGTPTPRWRRYDREIEQFTLSEASVLAKQFPDRAGSPANWGKVRWQGKRVGRSGDVRIQFRTGTALDTHVYARRLGPGLVDTRDERGKPLDMFTWIKLTDGRVAERELEYNELGTTVGEDGLAGWSYWSAPLKFEEGLVPEGMLEEQRQGTGVQLPIPGGTRYLQFRVLFDNGLQSTCMLDYIEFDYDAPLVSGGVLAEIYPAEVPLGQEVVFHYYLSPRFGAGDAGEFNRIEIDVPDGVTHIDTLKFDDRPLTEVAVGGASGIDPLASVATRRLAPAAEGLDSLGQFAQAVVTDAATGNTRLLVKMVPFGARHFRFSEQFEIVLRSRLYRGSKQFTSSVWNDRAATRGSAIPQPTQPGDVTAEVATDGIVVVARKISGLVHPAAVAPNPFSPNGDGINDQVRFAFDLFLVLGRVTPKLTVHDLTGREVRRLDAAANTAGRVEIVWDGRDADGCMVPPGNYLYRLRIGSDEETREQTGVLGVAY